MWTMFAFWHPGRGLRLFEITKLTMTDFEEKLVLQPVDTPVSSATAAVGQGDTDHASWGGSALPAVHGGLRASGIVSDWNGEAMHHMDAHQLADGKWVALVDGLCRCDCFDLLTELSPPSGIFVPWISRRGDWLCNRMLWATHPDHRFFAIIITQVEVFFNSCFEDKAGCSGCARVVH